MAGKILGIDIGSGAVKLALLNNGRVHHMAAAPLPAGLVQQGGIDDVDALAATIRQLMKSEGIRVKKCALTLPAQQAFTLRLTLPQMSEKQLLLNLPYEFHDYIDGEPDDFYFDYAVVGACTNEEGEPQQELLAACARKSVIRAYYQLFRRCGLTLLTVVPTPVAYWNLLSLHNEGGEPLSEFCAVDLGCSATRIYMYSHRALEADRNVDLAVARQESSEIEALNTQCALEINRALNFYSYSNRNSQLSSVWLCGGGAMNEGLKETLKANVNAEVRSITDILPPCEKDEPLGPLCAAAVGAAV